VGPNKDAVFLDLTHLPPEQLDAKLPDVTEFIRTYEGIEPKNEPALIQPTATTTMGGIPPTSTARWWPTRRGGHPGLYAAGECACVACTPPIDWGPTPCSTSWCSVSGGGAAMAEYVHDGGYA